MTHTPTSLHPDTTDRELREMYERCDVSNNRTDNPMGFDEFVAALKARDTRREAEARIRALNDARSTIWAIGYDDDPTAILVRNKIWEMMQATEDTLKDKTKDE